MTPTELKMQPTIHLEGKTGYGRGKYPALLPNVLWVAFSILSGSLPLLKYPVDCLIYYLFILKQLLLPDVRFDHVCKNIL
jgi:hypothetical protein